MTDIVEAAGLGETIEHDGKTYRLAPFNLRMRAQLTQWCRERAKAAARETSEGLPAAQQNHIWAETTRDIAGGRYDFPSVGAMELIGSLDGAVHMRLLMLRAGSEPKATPELAEALIVAEGKRLAEKKAAEDAERKAAGLPAEPLPNPFAPAR
jgi:hypothetical protein